MIDYKEAWKRAQEIGERKAEAMYPASEPKKRQQAADRITSIEYRAMTQP